MKIKQGRQTITSKVAYIAGFFDGEGCVRIKKASQKGNSYYIWVAITNSDIKTLEAVQELFGGQIRAAEKSVNKTIYHFLITASEAVDMLKLLSPFLMQKRKQADLAIVFHERKSTLTPDQKRFAYKKMSALKK